MLRMSLRDLQAFAVLILLCCRGPSLFAQTQPPAQKQTATSEVMFDPTQREVQPPLSVDRDPVLSPDPEDTMPSPDTTGYTLRPGEIQQQKSGVYTLREDVDEVLLSCTVVDEEGRLVKDLDRGDFRVWEDDVPQTILSLRREDVPVSIGILVDNSGSMRDKRASVNAAALELVRISNPDDAAFIVNFSDRAYLDQDLTSNIK